MRNAKPGIKMKDEKILPRNVPSWLILFLLLFGMASFLYAQNDEPLFTRRIAWRGGENAWRYAVEIERLENGTYRSHLSEFTTTLFLNVSLPSGEYRFRIIPHDILDRPAGGTQWFPFEIRPRAVIAESPALSPDVSGEKISIPEREEIEVISVEDYESKEQLTLNKEQRTDSEEEVKGKREEVAESEGVTEGEEGTESGGQRAFRFHTVGASLGSSFIDPVIIVTVHGTYSPVRNLFIELGCDVGFVSTDEEVESYYSFYPYVNVDFFMPFRERGGFFAGAGVGYMAGKYTFEYGENDVSVWAVNITGGINLFNFLNISYTLRTDFGSVNSKVSAGYTYRFK